MTQMHTERKNVRGVLYLKTPLQKNTPNATQKQSCEHAASLQKRHSEENIEKDRNGEGRGDGTASLGSLTNPTNQTKDESVFHVGRDRRMGEEALGMTEHPLVTTEPSKRRKSKTKKIRKDLSKISLRQDGTKQNTGERHRSKTKQETKERDYNAKQKSGVRQVHQSGCSAKLVDRADLFYAGSLYDQSPKDLILPKPKFEGKSKVGTTSTDNPLESKRMSRREGDLKPANSPYLDVLLKLKGELKKKDVKEGDKKEVKEIDKNQIGMKDEKEVKKSNQQSKNEVKNNQKTQNQQSSDKSHADEVDSKEKRKVVDSPYLEILKQTCVEDSKKRITILKRSVENKTVPS